MGSRQEALATDMDRQIAIMQEMREASLSLAARPLGYVDTYGCQQNESDSEKLRGMLVEMGYGITKDENAADVAILNTCAVRKKAETRVLGNVGALIHTKTANPAQIIVFCGCLAAVPETVETIRESYKHVDLVFPPSQIWRFPEFLERTKNEKKRVFIDDDESGEIHEGLPLHRDNAVRAWLPIMYGCDNYCSYCIVPYVRGRERSRDASVILDEARALVASGCKDITLLGQNVNSYVRQGDGPLVSSDFPNLIRAINEIDGEFLIRFMTSHPKDASYELFQAMAECDKAARHIHLPFQAGSNRILKAMNRGYTKESYLEKIAMAKELMPDIVLTSDVIVGFPGESEADFYDTLDLIKKADFDAMFTFIFSKRPGTPAAEFPDNISREEKQTWFEQLVDLQNEISERKHESYIGKSVRILVDGEAPGEKYPLRARTNGGRLVHLLDAPELIGQFAEATITHCNNWSLFGEVNK
ncbi:MAG: tRNA (N6-isopentenyl adenosine(37)-C2)-methylthiotransferase MiaB [Oscillospiraceae bacterium]|nr:tRNA (N6-isopentenyl adenosine(37)-C2)-methylthiotransferase MiaB [Oscillospiraceae bacterium]MCL2249638.1 tRNA (N6-isopentenyl adenosine(37)-C2)-methylthiotransferase MiaB [Oscillospiraceae bacterium]